MSAYQESTEMKILFVVVLFTFGIGVGYFIKRDIMGFREVRMKDRIESCEEKLAAWKQDAIKRGVYSQKPKKKLKIVPAKVYTI
jgi:hypothetical protein